MYDRRDERQASQLSAVADATAHLYYVSIYIYTHTYLNLYIKPNVNFLLILIKTYLGTSPKLPNVVSCNHTLL